jgi:uncharacterized RDD family membrane protein YckC
MPHKPSWSPDPTGRHELRWWDGERWTEHVADEGVPALDLAGAGQGAPPGGAAVSAPATAGDDVISLPEGVTITGRGKRFGEWWLGLLLMIVTLYVGYWVWSLIIWERGQTPAKQLLKMRVVQVKTGKASNWGQMALRQLVVRWLISFLTGGLFEVFGGAFVLFRDDRRALWDLMVDTVVVDDPGDVLAPGGEL